MKPSHTVRPVFDEPNLVSHAGLVPAMGLAARAGLIELADRRLTVPGGAGCDAAAKVCSIVAGMLTGALLLGSLLVERLLQSSVESRLMSVNLSVHEKKV